VQLAASIPEDVDEGDEGSLVGRKFNIKEINSSGTGNAGGSKMMASASLPPEDRPPNPLLANARSQLASSLPADYVHRDMTSHKDYDVIPQNDSDDGGGDSPTAAAAHLGAGSPGNTPPHESRPLSSNHYSLTSHGDRMMSHGDKLTSHGDRLTSSSRHGLLGVPYRSGPLKRQLSQDDDDIDLDALYYDDDNDRFAHRVSNHTTPSPKSVDSPFLE
jgi:hypothetical protein